MPTYYSPRIVTDGLVLCLDAGNTKSYSGSGTVWNDLGINKYIATLYNGVGFNSLSNGSLTFDGTNDYILSDITSLGLNVEGPYTFSCFLKYNTLSGFVRNPITLSNTTNSAFQFGYINGSPIVWRYGGTTITTYTPPPVNTLYCITCTVSLSNVTVYINGVLNATTNTPNLQTGTLNSLICSAYWASGVINTSSVFNGNIYNINIYNRILSSTEVLQNYNATKGRYGL